MEDGVCQDRKKEVSAMTAINSHISAKSHAENPIQTGTGTPMDGDPKILLVR
jgi:hypothetical protein